MIDLVISLQNVINKQILYNFFQLNNSIYGCCCFFFLSFKYETIFKKDIHVIELKKYSQNN